MGEGCGAHEDVADNVESADEGEQGGTHGAKGQEQGRGGVIASERQQ